MKNPTKKLTEHQQMHYSIIYVYNLLHNSVFQRYYLAIFRESPTKCHTTHIMGSNLDQGTTDVCKQGM